MIKSSFSFWVEQWLFRHRVRFLVFFLVLTALFLGFATQTKVDARFEKQLTRA